jgi:glutamate transport system substrate-binding protein
MRYDRWAALAVSAVLAVTATGCGSGGGKGAQPVREPVQRQQRAAFAEGSTMARLSTAQKIRVGTKFDQPGFGLKGPDGKPAGFDVEIAKLIAAALRVPAANIEWTETPSAIREKVLVDNQVDLVVATYTINDKRKQQVDFAGPYYVAGQDLMVRGDDSSIPGPQAFKAGAKKVCTAANSTAATNIKKYLANETAQLMLVDVYTKCVDALKARKVDAVTTDNVVLGGFAAANAGQFKLVGQRFSTEPYGVGLHKGDNQFRAFVNDVLERSFHDGGYQKAWTATAGTLISEQPAPPAIDY